jgi:hypothetical protein
MILEIPELNQVWEKLKPILQFVLQSGFIMTAVYTLERLFIMKMFNKRSAKLGTDVATIGNNLLQQVGNSTIKVNIKPLVDNQFKDSLAQVETYIEDIMKNLVKANLERESKRDKVIIDMANVFSNAYGIGEEEKAKLIADIKELEKCRDIQEKENTPAQLTIVLEDEKEVKEQDIEVEDTVTSLDR